MRCNKHDALFRVFVFGGDWEKARILFVGGSAVAGFFAFKSCCTKISSLFGFTLPLFFLLFRKTRTNAQQTSLIKSSGKCTPTSIWGKYTQE